jgi:hypothetical protein
MHKGWFSNGTHLENCLKNKYWQASVEKNFIKSDHVSKVIMCALCTIYDYGAFIHRNAIQ